MQNDYFVIVCIQIFIILYWVLQKSFNRINPEKNINHDHLYTGYRYKRNKHTLYGNFKILIDEGYCEIMLAFFFKISVVIEINLDREITPYKLNNSHRED